MRTGKKVYVNNELTLEYLYVWENNKLIGSKIYLSDGDTMVVDYVYDSDELTGIYIDGDMFLFAKNLQGDITAVIDPATGEKLYDCYYDAWGNISYSQADSFVAAIDNAMVQEIK